METMETDKQINLTQLLLQISTDVSSIKTDMNNIKEAQRLERENTTRAIEDVRTDCHKEITIISESLGEKVIHLQDENKKIKEEIDKLKSSEDKKDAKKWRAVIAYLITAIGGMFVAKIPDIIMTYIKK